MNVPKRPHWQKVPLSGAREFRRCGSFPCEFGILVLGDAKLGVLRKIESPGRAESEIEEGVHTGLPAILKGIALTKTDLD